MNGNAPLAIVICEQQRIFPVDPGAPFISSSVAAHTFDIWAAAAVTLRRMILERP